MPADLPVWAMKIRGQDNALVGKVNDILAYLPVLPVPAANVTHGTFGSTTTDLGLYAFARDITVYGLTVGRGTGGASNNTAFGVQALAAITAGVANTGVGFQALSQVTDASGNTAVGFGAIGSVCTGNGANTAVGYQTLPATTGTQNVAVGYWSLQNNTTGNNNAACGYIAMQANINGQYNAALGYAALNACLGDFNVGVGGFSLYLNTGTRNTAVGYFAAHSTTGDKNTIIGHSALNTNLTGGSNVALGYFAGAYELGSNAFYVDNQDRTNTAGDKAKALLYGTFNATAASQTLAINAGTITVLGTISGVTTLTATTVAGTLSTANQPNITGIGTLSSGAVPASLVTAGTFAVGAFTLQSGLTISASGLTVTAGNAAVNTAINSVVCLALVGVDYGVSVTGTHTGSATSKFGYVVSSTIPSTTTSKFWSFASGAAPAASAFTLANRVGFYHQDVAKGASSTITNDYGVYIEAPTQGGTLNVGLNNLGTSSLVGITTLGAPVTLKGYTVAGLPTGVQGHLAFCTNLLAPTFLAPVTGGGLVVGPVFYDGTNWIAI